ncbi:MAG: DNA-binding response regulator [Bacteroidetes bacterium GWC2_33_15]|nr:MAG: DNA-binding response regulator [Bacteroidetes bacterium GWA2_33_15]OFX50941.1 MAG: DNA-binding response regulator [Bacteroidetes bacterium GWC2_33_15]OFX66554.1 MAG: DNA-binding response regulator [Bacteroidetes bacterium GWB2_32_14]OFX70167.1 MAG: DNA-binding response regulator [Bacteroidetes bacterium GWD2_33_33]HAN20021.1 DNA-binding response regulator [Bacteroidales bacterium]
MNCIALDDEPLALSLIEDFSKKIPYLNYIKSCKNAFEAIETIQKNKIDLIFLDINMPNITGIEFIKSLESKPMVIFTTAYSEFAVQGFELNAVDYLVKPFLFERFFKAVNKAYDLYNLHKKTTQEVIETHDKAENFIFVKSDYSSVKILLNDIFYIEGLKDYVKIHLHDKKILSLITMKKMEETLPADKFIRVHRSFIVALDKIESIQRNRIIIQKKWIPVGNSYKDDFFKRIDSSKL